MIWRRRFRNVPYGNLSIVHTQAEGLQHLKERWSLALVMANSSPKLLMFECPCGCQEILRINLIPGTRRAWRLKIDLANRASLYPSVDLMAGCRTHFVLNGNVARIIC